jgi:hypothetical protein
VRRARALDDERHELDAQRERIAQEVRRALPRGAEQARTLAALFAYRSACARAESVLGECTNEVEERIAVSAVERLRLGAELNRVQAKSECSEQLAAREKLCRARALDAVELNDVEELGVPRMSACGEERRWF